MTGYGKAVAELAGGKLTVEIRTLNGKSADVAIKSNLLPKELEMSLRKRISDALVRGTIDVFLSFEPSARTASLPVDAETLKRYYSEISGLRTGLPGMDRTEAEDSYLADSILLSAVLRFPDVVGAKKSESITESDTEAVRKAFEDALAAVDAYRCAEGGALLPFLIMNIWQKCPNSKSSALKADIH